MLSLPLFKSHYSIGKSILTLEEPNDKSGNPVGNSIFNIAASNNLTTVTLVEDSVSGLLQASSVAKNNKINLIFGLRIWVSDDALEKNEKILAKRAKYIIFGKNPAAYKDFVKIWSFAAKDGFYYEPSIDFKTLRKLWNKETLLLAIPFYDSFLFLNSFESHIHVPQLDFTKPIFFKEDNSLPFDEHLRHKIDALAKVDNCETLETQSIYYRSSEDFIAYLAVRCLHNRSTIEKPELNNMGSDEFNFDKWKAENNG